MRKFIIIAFLLCSTSLLMAQANYGRYNYYTAGVRFTYDMFNYNELSKVNANVIAQNNFSYGITAGYFVSYILEIHGGLRYAHRDVNVSWLLPTFADPNTIKKSAYRLRYVSVPIEVRLNVATTKHFKMNIGVGLMPEFRRRPQETVTYVSNRVEITEDIHTTKEFKKVLLAAPLNIYWKFNIDRHYAIEIAGGVNYYINNFMPNYLDKHTFSYTGSIGFMYDF